jgi:hypothetical protein
MDFPNEEIKLFVLRKLPENTKVRNKMNIQPRQSKREYVSDGKRYSVEKTPNKIIMTVSNRATTGGILTDITVFLFVVCQLHHNSFVQDFALLQIIFRRKR